MRLPLRLPFLLPAHVQRGILPCLMLGATPPTVVPTMTLLELPGAVEARRHGTRLPVYPAPHRAADVQGHGTRIPVYLALGCPTLHDCLPALPL